VSTSPARAGRWVCRRCGGIGWLWDTDRQTERKRWVRCPDARTERMHWVPFEPPPEWTNETMVINDRA
jgi:hypothetical protein